MPGGREQLQRKTKEEAEKLAEDRFLALKKHGTEFSKIPATAQKQAAIAWGMLSEHGLNFIEAANVAIRVLRPTGGRKTVADVVAELLASKAERFKAGGLDKRTHDDFKSRGESITEAMGRKLASEVTASDVEKWLRGLRANLPQRSVLNYRNTLAEVFRHAKAKQYCPDNPMERFTREDYKAPGGEPILWLIGVDEEKGVVGAKIEERSNWWAKVSRCRTVSVGDHMVLSICETGP